MPIGDLAGTDIYLIDQILKGRVPAGSRVLDVGCGGGRNLRWFESQGYRVVGVDREFGGAGAPRARAEASALPFATQSFEFCMAIAVLHFARDEAHFGAMLDEAWRVLAPGGVLFARFATAFGIESQVRPLAHGWYALPDGSERFLPSVAELHAWERRVGAEPLDPLKSALVENQRSMTTWVVRKR